ncbi:hypothetical protein IFR04_006239 [Cadophora malorum]|uniref:Uncharacterized protein n=1 Tax=Cadophora malorum TaxID=108018 RepID=A0A8H7TFI7_9HELO|nr:hypothetical protein IFR04_006239 [Cadophora malorum]
MVKNIKKIRTQTSTDAELLEECKNETNCGDCELSWTTPPKRTQIKPPGNTVAIVIDVSARGGAVRIFQNDSDERVGAVGVEEAENLVIVPWDSNWWFRVSGSLRVGYVEAS